MSLVLDALTVLAVWSGLAVTTGAVMAVMGTGAKRLAAQAQQAQRAEQPQP